MARRNWSFLPNETWLPQRIRESPEGRHRLILILQGLLLFLGLWMALTLRLPGEYSALEVGRPSPLRIVAPIDIEFVSSIRTNERRSQAESRAENIVYQTDLSIPALQRSALDDLLTTISAVRADPTLSDEQKREVLTSLPSAALELPPPIVEAIVGFDDTAWSHVRNQIFALYDRAMSEYSYALDEESIRQLRELSLPYWSSTRALTPQQREVTLFFINAFLRVNRTIDEAATNQRKQAARNQVEPVIVSVQRGENIVRLGEIVTPEMIEKLQATGALPEQLGWPGILSRGLTSAIFALLFMLSLSFYQERLAHQPRPMMVIVLSIVIVGVTARLLMPVLGDFVYAFPLATLALVFAVVFDDQVAVASSLLLSGLMGMMNNNLGLAVVLFTSCLVAILMVRGVERLLTFLVAGVGVACITAVTWAIFQTESVALLRADQAAPGIFAVIFFSGLNGLLSAIFALGIFNLVGQAAGVVTPLQLMELAHPNQPLLRKLVREAPGTYYHSVAVGNLAEAAAEAVGADALLLRVAALYHDIGKTIRPYFFTDNQMGRENVHNDLDPRTSAQIIVDHVREGVEMGRAAGLPTPIIDFIATHHGTHMIKHFYQLALQHQDLVNPEDFRYPGPRPSTREQGILMLADSVEATVRSKAQNGKLIPNRPHNGNGRVGDAITIDDLVGSIIDDRLRDGQLDETPLTLHDLQLIRKTFVTSLQSIYHPRVDYAPQVVRAS